MSLPEGSGGRVQARQSIGAPPPFSNTGGKITPTPAVLVDWLAFTVQGSEKFTPASLLAMVQSWLPRQLLRAEPKPHGWNGFKHAWTLVVPVEGETDGIGVIAWGGESQRGRILVSLSGGGCSLVAPSAWDHVRADGERIGGRISRLDLAADDMAGAYSVDTAAEWYVAGEFSAGGRLPSCNQRGNWLLPDGKGRTLYIGKRENGKMLRVYEKGKQLGDDASPWVRWELQLGNKDRVIPWSALTDRAEHFAGGFVCLPRIVEVAAARIKTTRATVQKSLDALVAYASRSYGRLVHCLLHHHEGDYFRVVDALRVRGVPSSLRSAWATREAFA